MIRLLQLLLFLVLAVIIWRAIRRWLSTPPPAEPPRFEPTGRCTRCGTYVPSAELDANGVCPRCRAGTA